MYAKEPQQVSCTRYHELQQKALLCRYAVYMNNMVPRFLSLWLSDQAIAAVRCKDLRDNIFGVSGMFDPVAKAILAPDFSYSFDIISLMINIIPRGF